MLKRFTSAIKSALTDQRDAKDSEPGHFVSNLGLRVANQLKKQDTSLLMSPYSLVSALVPLYSGSAGETYQALKRIFSGLEPVEILSLIEATNIQMIHNSCVNVSNHLLVGSNYPLKPEYINKMGRYTTITQFDSNGNHQATVDRVNSLVNLHTRGKIDRILTTIDHMTVAMLLNVLYFKADWKIPFDKKDTRPRDFSYCESGSLLSKTREVESMRMSYKRHMYTEGSGYQVLEMGYDNEAFSMGFILPTRVRKMPLLSAEEVHKYINQLESRKIQTVQIPKFKIEKTYDLRAVLSQPDVGLANLFKPGKCELPHMLKNGGYLYIGQAIQKVFVQVDEIGTEAAAVTMISVNSYECSSVPKPQPVIEFIADHPFMYYIRHRHTDTLLFAGIFN